MEAADEEESRAEAMEAKAGATGLFFFTKSMVASASRSLSFFKSMVASASRSLAGRTAAPVCLTGRAAFTMSKSSSSAMPWVATPLSSAGLELVLAPKPTCARDLPKARWVLPARPTDLARLRRQRITSSMAAMPPRSDPAPTAICTVSMVPLPASGTGSPALIAGGMIVSTV